MTSSNYWNKENDEAIQNPGDKNIVHISHYLIDENSLVNPDIKNLRPEFDLTGTPLNIL
ncbi:hypothetical protein JOC77_000416 [Peribacillus deserti]|uniref:Uncharacterized protein n=1 Tax=Peribacillus deserti TaxID=673318 RepID=A0ABS2QEQ4_9BACI|nr:hypothetical protein [Peribacillus deserti]MBM7691013.1 hypothetical protein [Peribacillus deserti]